MTLQYDGPVTIATGASREAKQWHNQTLQWGELLERFGRTVSTGETQAEYFKMGKDEQDRRKDVGGFVGGWLRDGRRLADHLDHRSLLTLDADFASMDLLDAVELYFGCAAAIYTTHKHTPQKPRLRLILPLSRRVDGDEYEAVGRLLASDLGIEQFDDTTYQPVRLMYWPSTSQGAEFIFDHRDGPWLDPDGFLCRYDDWRDASQWPEAVRMGEVRRRRAAKQGDPLQKPGLVGAFCRAYSIEGAIEAFLPDVYLPCEKPGRYTYAEGSTAAGLVVYDGGAFAYSNHATDPVSGRLCNAFDLVRLHLYGAGDEGSKPDTPPTRLPSYLQMVELARKDSTVKGQIVADRLEEARGDFGVPGGPEGPLGRGGARERSGPCPLGRGEQSGLCDDDWTRQLSVDRRGNVESTINNVYLILTHDPWMKGAIAYNELKVRPVIVRGLPWKKDVDQVNGTTWGDSDDSQLRKYLEKNYAISGKEKIVDGMATAAADNSINPVKDYLSGLRWDGVERLDTLLADYLGAEDTPYTRAVTRKTFTAAVHRVMRPGCKFDYVLVISGPQGRGKSTLVARMSNGWYTDSLAGIGTKEAYEGIQGYWLVELGELAAMRKLEIETIKNFISKQKDSYRAAYGRRVEDHPRQCVFIGTTNSTAFLRDDTGNRRFWPVRLGESAPAKTVWNDLTQGVVDQLWAEAVVLFDHGEALTLPPELAAVALEQQEDFTEDDPRAGEIQLYLDRLLPEDWGAKDKTERRAWFLDELSAGEGRVLRARVCLSEIWNECFQKDSGTVERQKNSEIRAVMRQMKGWRELPKKQWFGPYGAQKCFERIAE